MSMRVCENNDTDIAYYAYSDIHDRLSMIEASGGTRYKERVVVSRFSLHVDGCILFRKRERGGVGEGECCVPFPSLLSCFEYP